MDSRGLQFISGLSQGVGTELQRQQQAQREETARKEQMNFQRQLSENEIQARRGIASEEQSTRIKAAEISESGATARTGMELKTRQQEGRAERKVKLDLVDREGKVRERLQGLSGDQQERLATLSSDLNLRNAKDLAADQEFMELHRGNMAFERERGLIELRSDLELRTARTLSQIQKAAEMDMLKARGDDEQLRLLMNKGLELHQARELSLIDFKSTLYKAALGENMERLTGLLLGEDPESADINSIFAALVDSPRTNSNDLAKFMSGIAKGTPAAELFAALEPKLGGAITPEEAVGTPAPKVNKETILTPQKPATQGALAKIPKEVRKVLAPVTGSPVQTNLGGFLFSKRPLLKDKENEVLSVISASGYQVYLNEFTGAFEEIPDHEAVFEEFIKLPAAVGDSSPRGMNPMYQRKKNPANSWYLGWEINTDKKGEFMPLLAEQVNDYANQVGESSTKVIEDAARTYADINGGSWKQWVPRVAAQYKDPKTRAKVFAEALKWRL